MSPEEEQFQARFGGVGRLIGPAALNRLRESHVGVVGLGGVGSWAVEALARSGIGRLTLIDLDDVCISNVNRQLHAVEGELGRPKVEVMAQRALTINPFCRVRALQSFFLRSTAAELLQGGFDYVLDAIDSPSRKALLIASCHERSIPVITVGASGGRLDPTAIEVADLAQSSHDRLLQEVRRKLRQRHGFPRGDVPFGIECVLSRERVAPLTEPFPDDGAKASRLDCAGRFGTAAFVTGTFGFVAAWRIIRSLGAGGTASETSVESSVLPGQ